MKSFPRIADPGNCYFSQAKHLGDRDPYEADSVRHFLSGLIWSDRVAEWNHEIMRDEFRLFFRGCLAGRFMCILRLYRNNFLSGFDLFQGPDQRVGPECSGLRSKYLRCSQGCGEAAEDADQVIVAFGCADGSGDAGHA